MISTDTTAPNPPSRYSIYGDLWDEISSRTGFDAGEEFATEEQVRAYFTAEAQREMFGADAVADQDELTQYADAVIEAGVHCAWEQF